jgi:pimeloyl-ACP methyl ester carboxylesterase
MKNGKLNRRKPAGTEVAFQTNRESRPVEQIPAVSAMLNYYRASFRDSRRLLKTYERVIEHSTMVIWGMKDFALVPELIEGLEQWVPNLRLERIQDCGHWVPEEKPGLVTDLLLDFLLD